MIEPRLAAHVLIGALQRATFERGGFATVLHKGDKIAGSILVQCSENGGNLRLLERMPTLEGTGEWVVVWPKESVNQLELIEYLQNRTSRDPDLWVIELDIADAERLVAEIASKS